MSKKTYLLFPLFLLILSSESLFAQAQSHLFSFSVGLANPQDDFASSLYAIGDTSGNSSGFAKAGFSVKLDYTYQFADNFGVFGMFLGASNATDSDAMTNSFSEVFENHVLNASVAGDNWLSGGVLVGPNVSFYLTKSFRVNVRGGIGFYSGTSPEVLYKADYMLGEQEAFVSFKRQEVSATAFAWTLGGNMQYYFGNQYIILAVDWTDSNLDFKDVNFQMQNPDSGEFINYTADYTSTLDMINYSIGIGMRF